MLLLKSCYKRLDSLQENLVAFFEHVIINYKHNKQVIHLFTFLNLEKELILYHVFKIMSIHLYVILNMGAHKNCLKNNQDIIGGNPVMTECPWILISKKVWKENNLRLLNVVFCRIQVICHL